MMENKIYTKYQLDSVKGEKSIKSIEIKHDDESLKELKQIMFWAFLD